MRVALACMPVSGGHVGGAVQYIAEGSVWLTWGNEPGNVLAFIELEAQLLLLA